MRHDKFLTKNILEFHLYRKFGADTSVTFDTPEAMSDEKTKEESATKESLRSDCILVSCSGQFCSRSVFSPACGRNSVPVQEVVLDNGMKVLLVVRKGSPNVAAGWVAKVGSVNEHSGVTGISHLFEHMMFKGTQTIGTRNIEEDLKLNLELDRVKAELRKEERDSGRQAPRSGEITDAKDPKVRSPRHQQLLAEFDKLNARQKDAARASNEFDKIYTSAGAHRHECRHLGGLHHLLHQRARE